MSVNFNKYKYYDLVRNNIRKYRKEKNLTQEQLSELINISNDYMCEIESKTKNKTFSLVIVAKISHYLNIEFYKFFK